MSKFISIKKARKFCSLEIMATQHSAQIAFGSVLYTANASIIPNAACHWIKLITTMQNLLTLYTGIRTTAYEV